MCSALRNLSASAATTVTLGSDPKKVRRGSLVTPTVPIAGELVIEGDTTTCAAAACDDPADASVFTVTDGSSAPVSSTRMTSYNFFSKWTPQAGPKSRTVAASTAYAAFKAPYSFQGESSSCNSVRWRRECHAHQQITSVQETAPIRTAFKALGRNIENQMDLGLPAHHDIRALILDISSFEDTVDRTKAPAFVVNLAEASMTNHATNSTRLRRRGLLPRNGDHPRHRLRRSEFAEMKKVGTKLIWWPPSNQISGTP